MAKHVNNVFISHIHEDDAGLSKLKQLLANNGMDIRDSSINSSNPNQAKSESYIKSEILAPQIKWAGTLLVYVSPDTKNSEWVNWEIEYAAKLGKRIVGVWEQGAKDCELPEALLEYGDAMVGWHGNSIIDAIVAEKDEWETTEGSPTSAVSLKRHPC
ncbi:TIR domain-containing protein [Mesorhizobium sp. ORM8.1]